MKLIKKNRLNWKIKRIEEERLLQIQLENQRIEEERLLQIQLENQRNSSGKTKTNY